MGMLVFLTRRLDSLSSRMHPSGWCTLATMIMIWSLCSHTLPYFLFGRLQESDGGVFNVGNGSSATFSVPMTFESNSIAAEYSGGALYVGGKVKRPQYHAAPTYAWYTYMDICVWGAAV